MYHYLSFIFVIVTWKVFYHKLLCCLCRTSARELWSRVRMGTCACRVGTRSCGLEAEKTVFGVVCTVWLGPRTTRWQSPTEPAHAPCGPALVLSQFQPTRRPSSKSLSISSYKATTSAFYDRISLFFLSLQTTSHSYSEHVVSWYPRLITFKTGC